jgi:hypothetical protein
MLPLDVLDEERIDPLPPSGYLGLASVRPGPDERLEVLTAERGAYTVCVKLNC